MNARKILFTHLDKIQSSAKAGKILFCKIISLLRNWGGTGLVK